MSNEPSKSSDPGVLYLDADTEITEAIEKLKKSTDTEVRIVVPSRSGLLQSSVNVKLLKKAAKDSKKELVLVTNDKITKNLAGFVGIAVASSVKAMAHVPDIDRPDSHVPDNIQIDPSKEAAQEESAKEASKEGFQTKHITLDGEDDEQEEKTAATKGAKKDKKVPNYGKLNKRIWIGAGIAGVVLAVILGLIFLPTAKVVVLTDSKKTSLNFNFILDATASSSDINAQTLAAQKLETTKESSFEITATGKKEVGNKATGTVTVKNCDDVSTHNLPAGSGMTAAGKSFVTAQAVVIPAGSAGGGDVICSSTIDVQITATALGESYNLGASNFALTGFSSFYKATGQTSGGTTKTITILSAEDITIAKKQAEEQSQSAADELSKKAGSELQLFKSTIQADFVEFKTSVAQDAEADKVSVTSKIKYTGFAAKTTDVNKLFDGQIQIDLKGNKQVYENGSQNGTYTTTKQFSPEKLQLNVKTSAYYGDPIDKQAIAKQVAGKPKKEVADIVKKNGEQITGAQVEVNPGLLPNMPIIAGRITVDIKVTTP
ncbi:hypothetical protein EXS66_01125 [Candidatus Saccharibacteria bacterium]|nr:hypothetical protein [Candidatus Saccharibacteria bacterium]